MSVYRSVAIVNVLTAVGVVVGLLNNIVIAAFFGLNRSIDAYYAALVLPMLFMALCVDYLGKNFLPVFTLAKRQGAEAASELASSVITIVSGVAIVLAGLFSLFSEPLFSALLPGFSGEDAEVVRRYFWIMSPAIVLMVINTFHEYICQSGERYVSVATARLALPVASLCVILAANQKLGEYCLPVGFLLGNIVMFLLLAKMSTYRFRPIVRLRKQWERKIFINSFALMASGVVARSHSIVTSFFGSLLGSGAIAGFQLADKIVYSMQEATTSGIRMVAFTRASDLHIDEAHERLGNFYNSLILTVILLFIPILVYVGLHSELLIRLIFFRGQFTEDMVRLVTLALLGMIPAVIFFSVNPILTNAFYAMDMIKVPIVVMPMGAIIYLILAALSYTRLGIFGLAASLAISSGVVFVVLLLFLGRKLPQFDAVRMLRKLILYAALGLFAYWLPVRVLYDLEYGLLATLLISGAVGTGLYWFLLVLLRDDGLGYVYGHVRALIARRTADSTT